MDILLTNDDGYTCAGIRAMRAALREKGHRVWVLAPHRNMSACSQSITTMEPIYISPTNEEHVYFCNGTPTDCVILALRGYLGVTFQMVVSGINHGPNLGDDVTYSGTVAAARQGVLMGAPSLAVSLYFTDNDAPLHFENAASIIANKFEKICALSNGEHLININIPNLNKDMPFEAGFLSSRMYDDFISRYTPPHTKHAYHFMHALPKKIDPIMGSDWYIVNQNKIALSFISVHPHCTHTVEQQNEIKAL